MGVKVFALGNILMGDDGIAIEAAKLLEKRLLAQGIEVIYGETDIGYCISMVNEEDSILLLDAGYCEKEPGEITLVSVSEILADKGLAAQHDLSFPRILQLYYPHLKSWLLCIEPERIQFGAGISLCLSRMLQQIAEELFQKILAIAIPPGNLFDLKPK